MYILYPTTKFQKQTKKIAKENPQLKSRLAVTLDHLRKDLNYPSLRLHKLEGQNNWSVSVTKSIRVIIHIRGNKIYLVEIGKHEEVY